MASLTRRRLGTATLVAVVAAGVLLLSSEPDQAAADGLYATTPHCADAPAGNDCHRTHTWTGKKIGNYTRTGETPVQKDCGTSTGHASYDAASSAAALFSCLLRRGWTLTKYTQVVKVAGTPGPWGTGGTGTPTTTRPPVETGCTGLAHSHTFYGHNAPIPQNCHVHTCGWLEKYAPEHQRDRNCNWPTTTTTSSTTTSSTTTSSTTTSSTTTTHHDQQHHDHAGTAAGLSAG